MTQYRSALLHWLHSFLPSPSNTRPREWLRAALGTVFGVLLSTLACQQFFGNEIAQHLLGPLGASAFLLFAVSSGAMAQPWSILGSYLAATLVALLMVRLLGPTLTAACLAVGISLLLMCVLRCLHPPASAVALAVVLATPTMLEMGFSVLLPVMLNALCLLVCALLYNNLTQVRYPKSHVLLADVHHTDDPSPDQRVGIQVDDLQLALQDFGEFVDITHEDLERLIHSSEKHALRRSMGNISAAQIMSRDVQCASRDTSLEHALYLLTHHHLKALPVLDEQQQLVGIVSLIDLVAKTQQLGGFSFLKRSRRKSNLRVEQLMSSPAISVAADSHVVELIPLMSVQGLHCLPVLEQGKLVGIITQTDLVAALHRDLILHLG